MDFKSFLTAEAYKVNDYSVHVWAVAVAAVLVFLSVLLIPRLQHWLEHRFQADTKTDHKFLRASAFFLYAIVALVVVSILGLYDLAKFEFSGAHKEVASVLDLKLFSVGKTPMTVWTCFYVFGLAWLLFRSAEKLNAVVVGRLLAKTKLDRGFIAICAATVRYTVMILGAAMILQTAGIDLSALSFVAGAAGIAIGLGLQNLMNNVVSGFVILVDRPIRVGDRIDIGGVTGDVTSVSLRATTVVTNDGVAVIVPNSQFISNQVVNWTYISRTCRFRFPFTTARSASPSLIQRLLTEVAREHPGVAKNPPAKAAFEEIGENNLKFSLSVWTQDYVTKPGELRSDINFAIAKKFAENGLGLDGLSFRRAG